MTWQPPEPLKHLTKVPDKLVQAVADKYPLGSKIPSNKIADFIVDLLLNNTAEETPYYRYEVIRALSFSRVWEFSDTARALILMEALRFLEGLMEDHIRDSEDYIQFRDTQEGAMMLCSVCDNPPKVESWGDGDDSKDPRVAICAPHGFSPEKDFFHLLTTDTYPTEEEALKAWDELVSIIVDNARRVPLDVDIIPCLVCGEQPFVNGLFWFKDKVTDFVAVCHGEDHQFQTPSCETSEEAISIWNANMRAIAKKVREKTSLPTLEELEGWLSLDEAAERAGVSFQTVALWRIAGHIRAVKTRREWLYDPQSLDSYLKTRHAKKEG